MYEQCCNLCLLIVQTYVAIAGYVLGCNVTLQLVPHCKWSPRTIHSNLCYCGWSPESIMATTDSPPCPQVVPWYISILYNFWSNAHHYREPTSK